MNRIAIASLYSFIFSSSSLRSPARLFLYLFNHNDSRANGWQAESWRGTKRVVEERKKKFVEDVQHVARGRGREHLRFVCSKLSICSGRKKNFEVLFVEWLKDATG